MTPGRPESSESNPFYHNYIALTPGDDPVAAARLQLTEARQLFGNISEQISQARYVPDKWSLREVLNHVNDTERMFAFRLMWFARGLADPLPKFDQELASRSAGADRTPWSAHVDEFVSIRQATIALLAQLPTEAWGRTGVASGFPVTVRALAFIIPGHTAHHLRVIGDRYLR